MYSAPPEGEVKVDLIFFLFAQSHSRPIRPTVLVIELITMSIFWAHIISPISLQRMFLGCIFLSLSLNNGDGNITCLSVFSLKDTIIMDQNTSLDGDNID